MNELLGRGNTARDHEAAASPGIPSGEATPTLQQLKHRNIARDPVAALTSRAFSQTSRMLRWTRHHSALLAVLNSWLL
ncbi:uncharacterized protein ARMOST_16127 [Armillaria ostoyae]|uniref:Uncharacterized protein n=1 Tax=Armillaria ostoyae TaxID=47428 RepID=A0A284RVA8_ARMOS|nr:uncharacterized protein ARMOST_16127 [Armillaria ostoyae]